MKKITQQDMALQRQTHVIFKPVSTKPAYSNIQIYNSHQILLFDFSCNECVNKEYCPGTEQKCTRCEIDEAIVKSGVFDIQTQVHGTKKSTYFINTDYKTDEYDSLDIALAAIQKIEHQYSR